MVQQQPIVIAPAVDQVQPTAQPTVGVAQLRVVNLVRQSEVVQPIVSAEQLAEAVSNAAQNKREEE